MREKEYRPDNKSPYTLFVDARQVAGVSIVDNFDSQ